MSQEWRCGEPIRRPERQQERCRTKQRVKVIACQRPLLVSSSSAFAQPKPANPRARCRPFGKLLQNCVLRGDQRSADEKLTSRCSKAELQNPAHSLHTVGRKTSAVGPQHENAEVRGLMSEIPFLGVARDHAQLTGQEVVRRPGSADGQFAVLQLLGGAAVAVLIFFDGFRVNQVGDVD